MEQKRQEALRLYLTQGKTQREIALAIGVSERTIYSWIRKYAWDKLRYASYQAPAMIAENLCSQLVELQNAIDRREPGCRYPTKDESQISHRLIQDIEKMRKFPSMGVTMQVLQTFRNHLRKYDKELAKSLNIHLMLYCEERAASAGPYPLPNDYDNEKVSPMSLCDDEEPDYTQYYRYRLPEDEVSEVNDIVVVEDQQVTTPITPSQPAKTGSISEADLNQIEQILHKPISTKPRSESKTKLEQQLKHWKEFAQKVHNTPTKNTDQRT